MFPLGTIARFRRTALALGCATLFASVDGESRDLSAGSALFRNIPATPPLFSRILPPARPTRAGPSRKSTEGGPSIPVTSCGDDAADPATLRNTIANAPDGATIDLTQLPVACSVITLENGSIEIGADLRIVGPGKDTLTIDAGGENRIFYAKYSLSLSDVTLTGGSSGIGKGGCIFSHEDLGLDSVAIMNCSAGGDDVEETRGGAVHVVGDLTMQDSSISGSTAEAVTLSYGGGAYVGGDAVLVRSSISDSSTHSMDGHAAGGGLFVVGSADVTNVRFVNNSATSLPDSAAGGGFAVLGATSLKAGSIVAGNTAAGHTATGGGLMGVGALTISHSRVTGNVAQGNSCGDCLAVGGGVVGTQTIVVEHSSVSNNLADSAGDAAGGGIEILAMAQSSLVRVHNTTISGNTAAVNNLSPGYARGGGIEVLGDSSLLITNSTIAFNSANDSGGGISGSPTAAGPWSIDSAIFAGNAAADGPDIAALDNSNLVPIEGTNNIVMSWSDEISFVAPPETTDPQLFALANNGGNGGPTHALGACSLAINAGSNLQNATTDARGDPFVREYGGAPDMGAHENQPFTDRIFLGDLEHQPCLPN